ncbi:hypothetical protein [Amycolatopsis sp. cmx-4-68]|uniref:hypothetical protein n=1 Tax=Amycolatopsis sp. cmx-4-68 TaxID=2790938 RepID=UPI00397D1A0E
MAVNEPLAPARRGNHDRAATTPRLTLPWRVALVLVPYTALSWTLTAKGLDGDDTSGLIAFILAISGMFVLIQVTWLRGLLRFQRRGVAQPERPDQRSGRDTVGVVADFAGVQRDPQPQPLRIGVGVVVHPQPRHQHRQHYFHELGFVSLRRDERDDGVSAHLVHTDAPVDPVPVPGGIEPVTAADAGRPRVCAAGAATRSCAGRRPARSEATECP